MAEQMSKNVALYLNAVERTIQYKSVQKQINDSYYPKLAKIICDRDELLDEKDNLDSRI